MPSALLVVDVQNAVVADLPDPAGFVQTISDLVSEARRAGAPVIWVQHADEDMPYGSEGWQMAPGLEPGAEEPVIQKTHRSAFAETKLAEVLREAGADRVVLVGSQSAFCVDMAGKHALAEGFSVTLVSDGHSNGDLNTADGLVRDSVITALINRTWSSLRHPGLDVKVLAANEIVWGTLPDADHVVTSQEIRKLRLADQR